MPNGSGNNALFTGRSSMSYNEQQNHVFIIGGALWALSFVVGGVASLWYLTLNGLLVLVAALLQTIGAMVVAATDADLDMFAKKYPRSVFAFALAWIVLYTGLNAWTPPIRAIYQVFWLKALPFAYLFLRYTPVLQMHASYPRFSDLLAYSLVLDVGSWGPYWFLYSIIYDGPQGKITWPDYLLGTIYVLGGTLVFGMYWHFRNTDTHSCRSAVSTTLYAYLLTYGFCNLTDQSVYQYAYGLSTPLIEFAFPIIHITLPLAYLLYGCFFWISSHDSIQYIVGLLKNAIVPTRMATKLLLVLLVGCATLLIQRFACLSQDGNVFGGAKEHMACLAQNGNVFGGAKEGDIKQVVDYQSPASTQSMHESPLGALNELKAENKKLLKAMQDLKLKLSPAPSRAIFGEREDATTALALRDFQKVGEGANVAGKQGIASRQGHPATAEKPFIHVFVSHWNNRDYLDINLQALHTRCGPDYGVQVKYTVMTSEKSEGKRTLARVIAGSNAEVKYMNVGRAYGGGVLPIFFDYVLTHGTGEIALMVDVDAFVLSNGWCSTLKEVFADPDVVIAGINPRSGSALFANMVEWNWMAIRQGAIKNYKTLPRMIDRTKYHDWGHCFYYYVTETLHKKAVSWPFLRHVELLKVTNTSKAERRIISGNNSTLEVMHMFYSRANAVTTSASADYNKGLLKKGQDSAFRGVVAAFVLGIRPPGLTNEGDTHAPTETPTDGPGPPQPTPPTRPPTPAPPPTPRPWFNRSLPAQERAESLVAVLTDAERVKQLPPVPLLAL